MSSTQEIADRRGWGVIPERMARRPVDSRGFPVPWFVMRLPEGGWDFRVIRRGGFAQALTGNQCWLCGERLGRFMCFTVGPMCVINRVSSEPPSHLECALFAVRACPFLTRPRMRRNDRDMPPGTMEAAGFASERNPGGAAIYTTRSWTLLKAHAGVEGTLIQMGAPESVAWFVEGRPASGEQARALLASGADFLREVAAEHDGPDGMKAVEKMIAAAYETVPNP